MRTVDLLESSMYGVIDIKDFCQSVAKQKKKIWSIECHFWCQHDNSKKIMKLIYKENNLHPRDMILNNRMEFLSFKRVSFLVLF